MPRYCAVKVCRNRGGTAPKQENKRISFYPFPLQDKSRLQRWVDNMKREEWTPSRHQYLCSEHFTEDCFDIRWGIRYLKNTAVPTIFPSTQDDEKKATSSRRTPKVKARTCDADTTWNDSCSNKKPLILTRAVKASQSTSTTRNPLCEDQQTVDSIQVGLIELPLASDLSTCPGSMSLDGALQSEFQTLASCELQGDNGLPKTSCLSLSHGDELHPQSKADSTVTVLCCESLGSLSDGEATLDMAALQAESGQAFSFVPMELIKGISVDCVLEGRGHNDGEHVSVYEHSYCRPDTDKEQLWSKIVSLRTKILELDRREESTVAKIRALENEIVHLKRDSAVFEEKQKVLEDYISSVLL
ncbi:THAP domain-containing protein 5-like [Lampris incognitus]|uniref:THAP domain-containing protein 5-like n=1 Tax=Lampris incognitus TaxID=2546036 RepID=UPI0024B4EA95|nr:THAP domain-containing protein 5-like [Lampris incognitus]